MTNPIPDLEESPMDVAEVAEDLGCSSSKVKRLIRDGVLPAYRLPSPKGRGHLHVERWHVKALKPLSRV